jgi:hypothetical protein
MVFCLDFFALVTVLERCPEHSTRPEMFTTRLWKNRSKISYIVRQTAAPERLQMHVNRIATAAAAAAAARRDNN